MCATLQQSNTHIHFTRSEKDTPRSHLATATCSSAALGSGYMQVSAWECGRTHSWKLCREGSQQCA